jgi:hypothetical protein
MRPLLDADRYIERNLPLLKGYGRASCAEATRLELDEHLVHVRHAFTL